MYFDKKTITILGFNYIDPSVVQEVIGYDNQNYFCVIINGVEKKLVDPNIMYEKKPTYIRQNITETEFIDKIYQNEFNYNKIFHKSYKYFFNNKDDNYDINVIIPVRGREAFLKPLLESFKLASKTNLNIIFTVVEHSHEKIHEKISKEFKANYIWINCDITDVFNKCLCHNIGAICTFKSKYLLFHDLDCLVQKNFFQNIFKNLYNNKVIQTFTKRRVLYCDEYLTDMIIKEKIDTSKLNMHKEHISEPHTVGAPGGSIMIDFDLFLQVGGYDADLFTGYSPEDAFFWEKVSVFETIISCDEPKNEIYHMYHENLSNSNKDKQKFFDIYYSFLNFNKNQKLKFIKQKSDLIKQTFISLNDYFDKIYCINLDKRKDRWQRIENRLLENNIIAEKFSAIDGTLLNNSTKLTNGALGCILSHLEIIKNAKHNNYKKILIMEDDAIFINNINLLFIEYYKYVPENWKLLYFGGNHNSSILEKVTKNVFKVNNTYTTHMYAVDHSIYDDIIKLFSTLESEADVMLAKLQKTYPSYVFKPHLAWQEDGYSDILDKNVNYNFLK